MRRAARLGLIILGCAAAAVAMGLGLAATFVPTESWHRALERTPGELVRYTSRRLEGHDKLQTVAQPVLGWVQRQVERAVPPGELPALGKGQREHGLAPLFYGVAGVPTPATASSSAAAFQAADVRVSNTQDLARALGAALPGQVIEVDPGEYLIDRRLVTGHAGTERRPIALRAARPGTVVFRVRSVEAIVVTQPYWLFENLTLRGDCARHGDCEHAFHVVGKARGTVLRNNRIEDFNAHVKVNGEGGFFPDDGLLQFSTLMNGSARQTDRPVTPVDIVAASGWRVVDNLVGGFTKAGGDRISYGLFMKGAGSGGRIDRNLVICSTRDVSQPGVRVGISLGGGGTATENCRDATCAYEHSKGIVVNNIIAHCNDFGIDAFRAVAATVAHNTLINTAGIDIRREPSSALVSGNVLDGRIRTRDGAIVEMQDNVVTDLPTALQNPDALAMRWLSVPYPVPPVAVAKDDFCGDLVGPSRLPGAVGARQSCGP